jgi:iron(III) transport system permease protein
MYSRRATLWLAVALAGAAVVPFLLTTSPRERGLALNTLLLVAGTCAISLPLGTLLAVLVARTDVPGRKLLVLLLAMLLFMPLYVQNASWQAGFGQQGWWELLFSRLGAPPPLDRWRGAIWIHAVAAVPWVALIVGAALRQVEPELEEAALVEGSPWLVLWRVTLRRSLAAIIAAGLWIAVAVAGEITITDMWQLRTYAEEVYIGFALGDTIEEVTLHVLPGVILVVWLGLAALVAIVQIAPHSAQPQPRPPLTFRLGRWRWPLTIVAWLTAALLVGVPLGSLVVKLGFVVTQDGAERVRSWSLAAAGDVLVRSPWEFRREILWSLITGSMAATVAVVVATPLAWAVRQRGVGLAAALLLVAILLAIPGPILGLGLIKVFNNPQWPWLNAMYDRSIVVVVIALFLRALPLAILVLWHALASVPTATLEIAALEGAGAWRRLWRVALPQRLPAIAAAWLVALALAIGDLSASFLVLPPGLSLLSRRIFEEAHYGVDNRLAGLTLTAIGLVSLIAAMAILIVRLQLRARMTKSQ